MNTISNRKIISLVMFLAIVFTSVAYNVNALQEELIIVMDGSISETVITRGSVVNFHGTAINLGNDSVEILSLNADFIHYENITQYNINYTVGLDLDHRTIGPKETYTATLQAEITNYEAKYKVSIYFVIANPYNSTVGPVARDFYLINDLNVTVLAKTSSSGPVLLIGTIFAIGIGIVVLYLIYGWLKERRATKKYA